MEKTFARHYDRLVLVSYRLPFRVLRNKLVQNSGGLVSAILALAQKGGTERAAQLGNEIVWIGKSDDTPEELARVQSQAGPFTLMPVHIEDKLNDKYYGGFCNDTIWPLFHYFRSLTSFVDIVSRPTAERMKFGGAPIADDPADGLVWIHDYQLMLLPGMIREPVPGRQYRFFFAYPLSFLRNLSADASSPARGLCGASWAPTWPAFIPSTIRSISSGRSDGTLRHRDDPEFRPCGGTGSSEAEDFPWESIMRRYHPAPRRSRPAARQRRKLRKISWAGKN